MYCKYCGAGYDDDTQLEYCVKCGKPLDKISYDRYAADTAAEEQKEDEQELKKPVKINQHLILGIAIAAAFLVLGIIWYFNVYRVNSLSDMEKIIAAMQNTLKASSATVKYEVRDDQSSGSTVTKAQYKAINTSTRLELYDQAPGSGCVVYAFDADGMYIVKPGDEGGEATHFSFDGALKSSETSFRTYAYDIYADLRDGGNLFDVANALLKDDYDTTFVEMSSKNYAAFFTAFLRALSTKNAVETDLNIEREQKNDGIKYILKPDGGVAEIFLDTAKKYIDGDSYQRLKTYVECKVEDLKGKDIDLELEFTVKGDYLTRFSVEVNQGSYKTEYIVKFDDMNNVKLEQPEQLLQKFIDECKSIISGQ
ncbi:MAG: hypothetical protein K6F92_07025 [Lachnospiraceae bacterium]|nr:hypothetical protein [Lachnospiraceae bacterium]